MTKNNIPSFSYRNTKTGIVVSILAVVIIMITTIVFVINPNKPQPTGFGGLAYPASLPSMSAGCGDIYRIPPVEGNFGIIPEEYWELNEGEDKDPIPVSPEITVPMFGYMNPEKLGEAEIRFYTMDDLTENPLDPTKILRSMYEDDIIVIWYTQNIDPSDLAALRATANSEEYAGTMLVAPWVSGRQMIQNRTVAFSAWGMSQTCSVFSEIVLDEFIAFEEENRVERPLEAPDAPMTDTGKLLPIGPSIER